jgi:GNAT superfamily N-acetyltransferase
MENGQLLRFPDSMSRADIKAEIDTNPKFEQFLLKDADPGLESAVATPGSPEAQLGQLFGKKQAPDNLSIQSTANQGFEENLSQVPANLFNEEARELGLKTGGGLLGSVLGAPAGPMGIAGGGTLGTVAGDQLNNVINMIISGRGLPIEEQLEGTWDALVEGAGGEAIGPVLGKVASKILKPYSGEVSPVLKAAEKAGIPLRTSTVAPGKIARFGEFLSETTVGGKAVLTNKANQVKIGLKKMADEFKEKLPFIDKTPDELKVITNEAYENAKRTLEGGIKSGKSKFNSIDELRNLWESKGLKIGLFESKGRINLSKMIVEKEKRGEGIGTDFVNDLIEYANSTNQRIELTPSKSFGATSVNRLKDFYKRFGFVENKGKNKDFTTRELFFKEPEAFLPETTGKINMSNSIEALEKMRDNFPAKSTKARKFIDEYLLKGDEWTAQDVIDFQSGAKAVRNLAKRKTTEKFREQLLDSIKSDVGDEAFESMSLAREASRIGFFRNKVQRVVNLFEGEGKGGARVIDINESGETVLNPALLKLKFDQQKVRLKNSLRFKNPDGSFNDDIYENLEDFVELVDVAAKDVIKAQKKTIGSFPKAKAGTIAGLAAGGKFGGEFSQILGPLVAGGLIVGEGAGPLIAWSMTNPKGVIKTWLTKGFGGGGKLVPEAVKQGTRTAIIEGQQREQKGSQPITSFFPKMSTGRLPSSPANIQFAGAGGL